MSEATNEPKFHISEIKMAQHIGLNRDYQEDARRVGEQDLTETVHWNALHHTIAPSVRSGRKSALNRETICIEFFAAPTG